MIVARKTHFPQKPQKDVSGIAYVPLTLCLRCAYAAADVPLTLPLQEALQTVFSRQFDLRTLHRRAKCLYLPTGRAEIKITHHRYNP